MICGVPKSAHPHERSATVSTIDLGTTKLEIVPDEMPENPRNWDNLGTLACWHRRYRLGDRHGFRDPQALAEEIRRENALALPVFLFDHSGLTLATDPTPFRIIDPAGWDWGQVGIIFAPLAGVRRAFGARRVTRRVRWLALATLQAEVDVYGKFLAGEVFGFVLRDSDTGAEIDSCWGFLGADPLENGMADCLPPDTRAALLALRDGGKGGEP